MTEVSSIVSLDRDGAGRPTCLRAMTEGDTISDSVLSQNVNDAVTEVNNNSNDWNDAYQVVYDNSASWNSAVTGVVTHLDNIGDVDLTVISPDQTIKYDGVNWVNVDYELSQLADVNITPVDKDVLQYDAGSGKWIGVNLVSVLGINDLSDVDITSPLNTQLLYYNSASNQWKNAKAEHSWLNGTGTNTHAQIDTQLTNLNTTATIVANNYVNWNTAYSHVSVTGNPHSTDLTDLEDVNIPSTPTDGYVLTWNNTGNYWEAQAPTGGGATDLDDLTDVVVVTPASNQFLVYDTTSWTNKQAQHTWLNGTGTNSHTQIDSHVLGVVNASSNWQAGYTFYTASADELASVYKTTLDGSVGWEAAYQHTQDLVSNPHMVTAEQVGNTVSQWNASALDGYKVSFVDTPPTFTGSQLIYNIEKGFWEANRQSFTLMAPNTGSNVTNTSSITLIGAQGITVSGSTNTLTFSISSNTISQWNASALRGSPLSSTLVPTTNQALIYNGSVWTASSISTGGGGVTDHGALTGLADDDHPQYVLSATNNALSSLVNNHIASAVHWDIATLNNNYINASGDSANAAFFFQTLSATTVSATTYLNLPSSIATWNASALQGKTLNAAAPTINEILRYNGTQWINDSETQYSLNGELGAGWTINAASGINFTNTATNTFRITANYTSGIWNASALQGSPLSATLVPTTNQGLIYNGSVWTASTLPAVITDHGTLTGLADDDHPQYVLSSTNNALSSLVNNHVASASVHFVMSSIDHTLIQNIGTNSHADIDNHISDQNNPHIVTAEQVGNTTAQWNASSLFGYEVKDINPNNEEILQWNNSTLLWVPTPIFNTTAKWNASAIAGSPLSATLGPTTGQSLVYNGSVWTASTVVATGGGGGGGIADASSLRGSPLSATLVPTAGQALMYNGSVWTASAALFAYTYGSGAPTGGSDGDIYLQTDVEALQVPAVSATSVSATTLYAGLVSATTYLNVIPYVSAVDSATTTTVNINGNYDTYLVNTTTTGVTLYLPDASAYNNKKITVSKIDDGGSYKAVTLSGAQLQTATNTVLLYDPTESVTVISNGTNWYSMDYDRAYGVVVVCKNSTGSTLAKGTPVKVTGATGANILIGPVSASNTHVPQAPNGSLSRCIGVVEHNIPNGEFGHVLTKGVIYKFNTNAYNEGDILYLASSGGFTNVKPTPPYDEVFLGIVTRKQSVNGSILIDVANPIHLNDIVGFNLASSLISGDLISYDTTTSTFTNVQTVNVSGQGKFGSVSATTITATSGDLSTTKLTDYSESKSSPTISSSALTLNLNNSQVFTVALNSNISTLTISNVEARANTAQGFTLILTADGTARTITWPGSVKWPSGTGPTLTSTNNKVDILSFVSPDNGTTWYGFIGGQNF